LEIGNDGWVEWWVDRWEKTGKTRIEEGRKAKECG
jgi:hypothetical protein